jgi:hypothetical protein
MTSPGSGIGQGLIRFVSQGLIGSAQTWSCSLWLDTGVGTGAPTQAQLNAVTVSAEAAWRTFWTGLKPQNCAAWSYQHTQSYYYLPNTTKAAMQAQAGAGGGTLAGTGSPLPFVTACVASLRSVGTGRSSRGRIYLPKTGGQVDANGQFLTTDCNTMANAVHDLIVALNAVAIPFDAGSGRVVIASFTKHDAPPITSVVVNSAPDVQHRRTDKIGAAYTATIPVA